MREVQGAICVASIVQLVIGYTGLLSTISKKGCSKANHRLCFWIEPQDRVDVSKSRSYV